MCLNHIFYVICDLQSDQSDCFIIGIITILIWKNLLILTFPGQISKC